MHVSCRANAIQRRQSFALTRAPLPDRSRHFTIARHRAPIVPGSTCRTPATSSRQHLTAVVLLRRRCAHVECATVRLGNIDVNDERAGRSKS